MLCVFHIDTLPFQQPLLDVVASVLASIVPRRSFAKVPFFGGFLLASFGVFSMASD